MVSLLNIFYNIVACLKHFLRVFLPGRIRPVSHKHMVRSVLPHISISTMTFGVCQAKIRITLPWSLRSHYLALCLPRWPKCLMFSSRSVAFSLLWMVCVHNHCLMSKIEGKPCKLWMPSCQRQAIGKTVCRHLFCTLETSCYLAWGWRGGDGCFILN